MTIDIIGHWTNYYYTNNLKRAKKQSKRWHLLENKFCNIQVVKSVEYHLYRLLQKNVCHKIKT